MAMLAVSSCFEKELEETAADMDAADEVVLRNLVEVPCEFIVQPFGNDMTKAKKDPELYLSNELKIYNFWLLQFDGSGKFLYATYHEPSSFIDGNPHWGSNMVKMAEDYINSTKLVWVVANIGRYAVNGYEYFLNYSGKTLSDFYNDGLPLSQLNQLKLLNGDASCVSDPSVGLPIPLSGSSPFDASQLDVVDDNKVLVIRLKSIVAKLTVNASAVAGASSLTLCGIPSRVSYAPDYVDKTTFSLLAYDYDVVLPSNKTVTLYVPQNKPMVTMKTNAQVSSGTASTKTANAPPKATYFSLGVTASSGKKLAINIFPGENEKDYNILANTHYKETVSVADAFYTSYLADGKKDSRLVEFVVQTEQSNCYMIHPLYQGTHSYVMAAANREEAYILPLVDRVNRAWSGNSAKTIGDNDEWVVHLLWQDEPKRLIYFSEASGLPAWDDNAYDGDDYAYEFYGKGNSDVYITAKRSTGSDYTRGNVLVALRKKTSGGSYTAKNGEKYGDILWSWHLWVTDYRPDDAGAYSSGHYKNVPGVSGSRVFHFDFWGTTSSATYKWIMDRNLGARGWEPAGRYNTSLALNKQTAINPNAEGYGTFYQWGRKDPFPGRGVANGINVSTLQLYNIEGSAISTKISSESASSAVSMASMHANPTALQQNINYSGMGGYWAWSTANEKSLYDPCPVGWVVPSYMAYRGFVSVVERHNTSNMVIGYVARDDDSISDTYYYGYNGYEAFAVDPLGSGTGTYPIYFPASGFINKAGSRDLGGLCDLWALDQKSATASSYLYIGKSLGATYDGTRGYSIAHIWGDTSEGANYFNKHYAFGMRCVKTSL